MPRSFRDVSVRGAALLDSYPRKTIWWKFISRLTVAAVAVTSRLFMRTWHNAEVANADILEEALKQAKLEGRGLLTIMNHVSILDDPLVWGVAAPPRWYLRGATHMRWTLGAEDIIFRNKLESAFFSLGQCLPVQRFGVGPFQAGMDAAVTLMDRQRWVHVFPEGFVHQPEAPHEHTLKFFRWGVSRLVLEPNKAPIVVPMYSHGLENVFPEHLARRLLGYGTHLPLQCNIGPPINAEVVNQWRQKWQDHAAAYPRDGPVPSELIQETSSIRCEVALGLRAAILDIKRDLKHPDEDPRLGLASFWRDQTEVKTRGLSMLAKTRKAQLTRESNTDFKH